MERRKHGEITPILLAKPYYFKRWDFCKDCGFIQHYEEFKIAKYN